MDPRRFLILACMGLGLSGCAVLRDGRPEATSAAGRSPAADRDASEAVADITPAELAVLPDVAEVTNDDATADPSVGIPYEIVAGPAAIPAAARPVATGRRAIAVANAGARAPSQADAFVGGVQVFAWAPGRVYEVWAAPLRVTTLTLGVGETLVSKAAGDTVRWQIGETTSGEGASRRTHVLLKPLQRGLETNLVLTTSRRVYFLDLKSGGVNGFNAAIAWDTAALEPPPSLPVDREFGELRVADLVATPDGPLDARYRIEPQGRRARWTPVSVFNDGRRTFIAFDPGLQFDEAPALFVVAPDGEAQMVNYRQSGGLFIVDRVFDRAELRLGDRRPQVVRIRRLQGVAR